MKNKLIKIFIVFFMLSFKLYASKDDNLKDVQEIQVNIDEANYLGPDPGNYDSGYVHDEEFIKVKSEELKQDIFNDYEKIDNIILYEALMESFEEWKNTKYQWGGDSHKGIDCSALTRRIYRDVFDGFELPRYSVHQVNQGIRVKDSELKPGDLLYFRPENRTNHVGVYVGNSLFINASSSRGVILSSLKNRYWKRYFKYGVRLPQAREIR